MSKEFSIEQAPVNENTHYHEGILKIINHLEKQVRSIEPNAVLHKELHEKRMVDARAEIKEFEDVRRDVCESFGVPFDEEHVYLYGKSSNINIVEQRALRAFFVLIDALTKEALYGEGRIDHITLYRKLCDKLAEIEGDPKVDFETVSQDKAGRYITFKGFVSTKEFAELSESNRKMLETPIVDEEGKIIETPKTWFITGHNLDEGEKTRISS
jgi:hypothetical protein